MSFGLKESLKNLSEFSVSDAGKIMIVPKRHYAPGYWVLLSATAKSLGLHASDIQFNNKDHEGYASAIGLSAVLDGNDDYELPRRREGQNYSRLVHLDCVDNTDKATQTVNDCIREFLPNVDNDFVGQFCSVVGDLHDNVWSHGKASGFSMAQKTKVPFRNDYFLEFALADCGIGFLRELQRVGMKEIADDRSAIEWCVAEGHSTKKYECNDDWTQSMPPDTIGNPLRGIERTSTNSGNHHQGLGLAKLIQFVKRFKGNLVLASGSTSLEIKENGKERFFSNDFWQGVAISCRIRASAANRSVEADGGEEIEQLMERLTGG